MRRKGLGKGLGKGYKNLVPMDSYVHALNACGVKSRHTMDAHTDMALVCRCGEKFVPDRETKGALESKKTAFDFHVRNCPVSSEDLDARGYKHLSDEELVYSAAELALDRDREGNMTWQRASKFSSAVVKELKKRGLVESKKNTKGQEFIKLKDGAVSLFAKRYTFVKHDNLAEDEITVEDVEELRDSFPLRDESPEDILDEFTGEKVRKQEQAQLGLGVPVLGAGAVRSVSALLGGGFAGITEFAIPQAGIVAAGASGLLKSEQRSIARTIKRQVEEDRIDRAQGITMSEKDMLKRHARHHTNRHIETMIDLMQQGLSFEEAHQQVQEQVGD